GQHGGGPVPRIAGKAGGHGEHEPRRAGRARDARFHDRDVKAMNGVHDMGGMHGMGPIGYEKDEPVFHDPWEGRVYAITRAVGAWGKWNIDASRHGIEMLPPADYLRMSYYEKWLARTVSLLMKHGLVTQEELETGKPAAGSRKATPPLTAAGA